MITASKKIIVDLLRHGEPEGGEVLRGRIDHRLSEKGWSQMQKAAALSAELTQSPVTPAWTHIISSPLQRCRTFAEHLAKETGLDLQVLQQWQEIDYGDWDGMPLTDWREQAASQLKAFRKDLSKLAPPNGEDYLSFKDRVLDAWREIARLPHDSHVLIVTHGGVLRVVLPTVLGMPLNRSYPLHIPFASFSRINLQVDIGAEGPISGEHEDGQNAEGRVNASLLFHNAAEYAGGF